jgi:hypothetical protein
MQLDGVTSVPNGQCADVFPAETTPNGTFAERQVLKASVTTDDLTCTGQIVGHSNILTRYCNSGKFDPTVSSECIFPGRQFAEITGTTSVFVPIQVDISPQTINTGCGTTPTTRDQGIVKFTIFGSEILDVTRINPSSLAVEGENDNLICDLPTLVNKDKFLDLTCKMTTCPNLGPALSNPNGTVDVTVTGLLIQSQTAILGEDTVKTSP